MIETNTKMNPEVKHLWLEALRSGEYEQGRGWLKNEDKYCCLGVLCDLALKAGAVTPIEINFDAELPPSAVVRWAGLPDDNPDVVAVDPEGYKNRDGVASHNDHGYTFEQIADMIEEQL